MHLYRYLGTVELLVETARWQINALTDLEAWYKCVYGDTATFVVTADGVLWLADQRSEHVSCARGADVLAAGELTFSESELIAATNLSTGYCPEPECWQALQAVLDRLGLTHSGSFTTSYLFRRCEHCGQRNVIKDRVFECGVCGAALPKFWNCDPMVASGASQVDELSRG
jgi:hypothetical protein